MRLCFIASLLMPIAAAQNRSITYASPQVSVQSAVQSISQQAGLRYDWQTSHDQTDPIARSWLRNVFFDKLPFDEAMRRILNPLGLEYAVTNGAVVLSKGPNARIFDADVTYTSHRKTAIVDLAAAFAEQARFALDRERSLANDPDAGVKVNGVSVKQTQFVEAMDRLLTPYGMRYQIEEGKIVLYRR